MSQNPSTQTLFLEPQLTWGEGESGVPDYGGSLRFRSTKCPRAVVLFESHSGVVLFLGPDDRPSGLFLVGGLSARAILETVRVLFEGLEPTNEEARVLPLDAPPDAWGPILGALGRLCTHLPPLPDDCLTLPPRAA